MSVDKILKKLKSSKLIPITTLMCILKGRRERYMKKCFQKERILYGSENFLHKDVRIEGKFRVLFFRIMALLFISNLLFKYRNA